jgi:hypothetical protein
MNQDGFHVFDTTLRDGAQHADLPPAAPDGALTVTVHNRHGAFRRLVATLGNIEVMALSYAATGPAHAVAEIRVAPAEVARARAKLNRLVDVLKVTEPQAAGDPSVVRGAAEAPGSRPGGPAAKRVERQSPQPAGPAGRP